MRRGEALAPNVDRMNLVRRDYRSGSPVTESGARSARPQGATRFSLDHPTSKLRHPAGCVRVQVDFPSSSGGNRVVCSDWLGARHSFWFDASSPLSGLGSGSIWFGFVQLVRSSRSVRSRVTRGEALAPTVDRMNLVREDHRSGLPVTESGAR